MVDSVESRGVSPLIAPFLLLAAALLMIARVIWALGPAPVVLSLGFSVASMLLALRRGRHTGSDGAPATTSRPERFPGEAAGVLRNSPPAPRQPRPIDTRRSFRPAEPAEPATDPAVTTPVTVTRFLGRRRSPLVLREV